MARIRGRWRELLPVQLGLCWLVMTTLTACELIAVVDDPLAHPDNGADDSGAGEAAVEGSTSPDGAAGDLDVGATSIDAGSQDDDASGALVDTGASVSIDAFMDTGLTMLDAESVEASVLDATSGEAQDAAADPGEAADGSLADAGAATTDATNGSVDGNGVLEDASGPTAISIDFVGGGIPMESAEIAGVFPAAHWNSCADASGTLSALVDSEGTAWPAAVTWNGGGVWQLPIADAPGDTRMMIGYLDPRTTSIVAVTGLPGRLIASGYDVYVYTNGDVPIDTTRAASYSIEDVTQVVAQPELTSFSGTFIQAVNSGFGNYVVFRSVTGASFTLTVRPVSGTGLRAPINGIQIVPAGL
jgi:hypothetical protein